MKILKDKKGKEIPEKERGEAMEKAHFLWNESIGEEEETTEGLGYDVEEILDMIYAALSGTSNLSAPGPDGINYKIL